MAKKFFKEFVDFLKEYKVIALAIAFIMGVAANQLVQSFVDNIIMPVIGAIIPGGNWQNSVIQIGEVALLTGEFLSDIIYFVIVAFVIFILAKVVLKEEKVKKK